MAYAIGQAKEMAVIERDCPEEMADLFEPLLVIAGHHDALRTS